MALTRATTRIMVFMLLLGLGSGCVSRNAVTTAEQDEPPASLPSVETANDSEPKPNAEGTSANETSAAAPSSDADVVNGSAPSEVNAAHILIMHQDSERVPPSITRTREEALAIAQAIALQAKSEGADFAALAKEHSDGPSGPNGGNLGNFPPEAMVAPFSQATLQLQIGEVSDPVETPFGFHIIRRQELQVIPKASAKHILVMYAGSMRAPAEIVRSQTEAKARIEECQTRLKQGEAFEDLAREYSDGPTGPNGGDLGEFPQGMMAPSFDEATFACEVGKVTDVVETPFGYHLIYRYK